MLCQGRPGRCLSVGLIPTRSSHVWWECLVYAFHGGRTEAWRDLVTGSKLAWSPWKDCFRSGSCPRWLVLAVQEVWTRNWPYLTRQPALRRKTSIPSLWSHSLNAHLAITLIRWGISGSWKEYFGHLKTLVWFQWNLSRWCLTWLLIACLYVLH